MRLKLIKSLTHLFALFAAILMKIASGKVNYLARKLSYGPNGWKYAVVAAELQLCSHDASILRSGPVSTPIFAHADPLNRILKRIAIGSISDLEN